ncbi:MAG: phage antirepressor protein [Bacteroidetes bacterium]|nr:MAG: phage antirepressor protein [Bacteroidota bacterium]TAG86131.1 MAG: phage antirepressor protein [Bacteroidota bacterium]
MEQLEIQKLNGIQVVDSRIIAKGLNIKHRNLIETINKYQKQLEQLGLLPFETEAVKNEGARGTKYLSFYYLNELQCNFVVTLSRNTEEVVDFKLSLVIAFDNAKKEVKLLEEVINESENYLEKKRLYYQKQGYSDAWIEKRLKSIEVRDELEGIWRKRGINSTQQYAVLTSIISKGAFGITPKQHSELKGLKKQSLRDNMTRLELAFMILAEEATAEFTEARDAQTYQDMKECATDGGNIAGNARLELETQTGRKVVSTLNFLPENRSSYQIPKNTK